MKKQVQMSVSLVILISFAVFTSSARSQLFGLSIAQPKEPVKAGTELRLLVTVTNTSNRAISFVTSPGEIPEDGSLYEISVRDAQGRSAPPSPHLRTRDNRIPINQGSRVARTLQPGESFVDQITVTTFYDLSQTGKYTISVAREIPPRQNLGQGSINSNVVTIEVIN